MRDGAVGMLNEFINQYSPFEEGQYTHVFESFIDGFSPIKISSILDACILGIQDSERPLILAQLIESIGRVVREKSYRGISLNRNFFQLLPILKTCSRSLIHVLSGIAEMLETTAHNMLTDEDIQVVVPELQALVDQVTVTSKTPYQQLYLVYRIWSLLASRNAWAHEALTAWGSELNTHLTPETLKNVHALESVVEREIADFTAMQKLLEYVHEAQSMESLFCALDVVVLQVLKKPATVEQSFKLDELKAKVVEVLKFLLDEANKSDKRDKSAKAIKFFCEYRMSLLGLNEIPDKLKREKGNIELGSKNLVGISGLKLNEYIIAELLDNGTVDAKLQELQSHIFCPTRE